MNAESGIAHVGSPRSLAESREHISRLLEVLLRLLALVKDGAVARRAEHVLVKVALRVGREIG